MEFNLTGRSPHRGRPLFFGLAAGLWLLAAGPAPPPAARAAGFPAAATGDLWFQADNAGFRDEAGRVVEEFYVRLPNNQVEFETVGTDSGQFLEGRVFVRLTFLDEDGNELGKAGKRFDFRVLNPKEAGTSDRVQLFLLREPLHPRAHDVEVVVEDLNARKRGLIYLLTKQKKSGHLRAGLVPLAPPTGFDLSDVQFVWSYRAAEEGAPFWKNGWSIVPNPARTFGLYQDTLKTYYEIYDQTPGPGGVYEARQEVRDDQGRVMAARTDTLAVAGGRGGHLAGLPIHTLPTGTYDLTVSVGQAGSDRRTSTTRAFNVVWTDGPWARTEEEVLAEARVLLIEEDFDRFKEMPIGDRESFLAAFWSSRDPSPRTARNELRELFLRRVDFAGRNFSTLLERGLSSDRGRIFIRYGQPDEIIREVMPRPGNSLSDVLDGMDAPQDLVADRTKRSRRDSDQSANFMDVDTRPYEIWSYSQQGEPLFPEREVMTSNVGLTFVFVDDSGTGHYVLRYSSNYRRY